MANSVQPNSAGDASNQTGATNDAKFDAILAKIDASALKKAERDAKTTEHKDVNGSMTNAARNSTA